MYYVLNTSGMHVCKDRILALFILALREQFIDVYVGRVDQFAPKTWLEIEPTKKYADFNSLQNLKIERMYIIIQIQLETYISLCKVQNPRILLGLAVFLINNLIFNCFLSCI